MKILFLMAGAGMFIFPICPPVEAGDMAYTNKSYALLKVEKSAHEQSLDVNICYNLDFNSETNIERNSLIQASREFFSGETNVPAIVHDPSAYWRYFRATNSFCGPMELRGISGKQVPLSQPGLNDSQAYPAFYSLGFMRQTFATKRPHAGICPPLPLIPSSETTVQLPAFKLEDYFKIKEPGEYQLTIWPKIYRRSDTNQDLCERIDLPSVTIPIHWSNPTN